MRTSFGRGNGEKGTNSSPCLGCPMIGGDLGLTWFSRWFLQNSVNPHAPHLSRSSFTRCSGPLAKDLDRGGGFPLETAQTRQADVSAVREPVRGSNAVILHESFPSNPPPPPPPPPVSSCSSGWRPKGPGFLSWRVDNPTSPWGMFFQQSRKYPTLPGVPG
ncbi:hypothetical protein BDP81DRAFT_70628 [Colletotrichum phormii]|uniref:Uncharacterized protein n=1 Tax=Colletotrichum phormii TaxID=359342 RepID=A0AAI9ZL90_9PEZI|nr:uncharacterized protein BDP81DRAFT_70628 [Colletotrichum phormii]KAK1633756.1 hypothetical protein BDP81DRAFT_70628 [Colletotrichum phormii]